MKICYVDEAGCTGMLPSAESPIQPILLIGSLFIDYSHLHALTTELIDLKKRFFPKLAPPLTKHLDWIHHETKGADLRRRACNESRNSRRHSMLYMSEALKLVESVNGKLAGRVWIKGVQAPFNGLAVYTSSLQSIYADFQNFLESQNDLGSVVVDSRLKHLNTAVDDVPGRGVTG